MSLLREPRMIPFIFISVLFLLVPKDSKGAPPFLDEWSPDTNPHDLQACLPDITLTRPLTWEQLQERWAEAALESRRIRNLIATKELEAQNPWILRLKSGSFDPIIDKRPVTSWLREPVMAPGDQSENKRLVLVQLFPDGVSAWTEDIEAKGAVVIDTVANNGLLISVGPDLENELPFLAYVRWAGPLLAGDKVSPNLAAAVENLETESLNKNETLEIAAYGWPAAGKEVLDNLVRSIAEQVTVISLIESRVTGNARLIFRVSSDNAASILAQVAGNPNVMSVERFSLPKVINDGSIWLLQSGDSISRSTPLFDHGLTGYGQIYGSADSGLDTDACQFRYSASSASQTIANDTKPPAVNITNPENKVMTYYLLPGAQAYDDSCGEFHGTHTTGCAVGDNYASLADQDSPGRDSNDGMAPGAKIVFQDAGKHDGSLVGLYYSGTEDIHAQAYGSGVRVHNNSFGMAQNSTVYDSESRNIDLTSYNYRDYLIVYAAGNNGDQGAKTLGGTGSTSKDALVVGAGMPGWKNGIKDMCSFSSRGPTSDGRFKPDIMAPGIVVSANENSSSSVGMRCVTDGSSASESKTYPNPDNQCATGAGYGQGMPVAGTSFSSPTAAGMAILARQYFTDGYYPGGTRSDARGFIPTNALVKAIIINSARNLTGNIMAINNYGQFENRGPIDPAPSSQQGFGVMTLDDALYFPGDTRKMLVLADIANGTDDLKDGFNQVLGNEYGPIENGDVHVYTLHDVSTVGTLSITLNWTDPPTGAYQSPALVNDLDLEVESPSGKIYRGNVGMNNGFSEPVSGNIRDSINNTERVVIDSQEKGDWQ
ncbi:MAG: S8 family serine peptidase, partial [Deltaproteobacteria bacterium]|nr:S8 family serine peptidase [Deltaproteobacteria bacterium]